MKKQQSKPFAPSTITLEQITEMIKRAIKIHQNQHIQKATRQIVKEKQYFCSFCGEAQEGKDHFVMGSHGGRNKKGKVYICEDCVNTCVDIFKEIRTGTFDREE